MVEVIRKIVESEMRKVHIAELGVVTSIFPHSSDSDNENYSCNVKLKNTELELQNVPVATQLIGLAQIPQVDDMVLVTFLNGDINAPIVIGRLYTEEDRPPANKGEEVIYVPPYSENSDLRRVHMELPSGTIISVTDDIVKVEAGETTLKINRDGDVVIESNAKVSITASEDMTFSADKITMESKQDMNIKAGTKATIKGETEVNVESSATMKIKAGATANIEAEAPLTLKGAMVNINP